MKENNIFSKPRLERLLHAGLRGCKVAVYEVRLSHADVKVEAILGRGEGQRVHQSFVGVCHLCRDHLTHPRVSDYGRAGEEDS